MLLTSIVSLQILFPLTLPARPLGNAALFLLNDAGVVDLARFAALTPSTSLFLLDDKSVVDLARFAALTPSVSLFLINDEGVVHSARNTALTPSTSLFLLHVRHDAVRSALLATLRFGVALNVGHNIVQPALLVVLRPHSLPALSISRNREVEDTLLAAFTPQSPAVSLLLVD
jgi:hypothetical protein